MKSLAAVGVMLAAGCATAGSPDLPAPPAPQRVVRSYTQHLAAAPERILPLLTPLGEKQWADGWEPVILREAPAPGTGTVFAIAHHGQLPTVWVLERFDAAQGEVRYVHVTPGSDVTEIAITLTAVGAERTDAVVRYTYTSLSPVGDQLLRSMSEAHYAKFMKEWEAHLNHFLTTGQMLKG